MRKFLHTLGEPARRFTNAPLRAALPILAGLALIINIFLEIALRFSLVSLADHVISHPLAFLTNVLVIFLTLSLCLLFKRRFATAFLVSFLWILLGVINLFVMLKRGTPLSAIDFLIIKEAFSIAGAYFTVFHLVLIGVLLVLAVTLIVLLFIKGPRRVNVDYKRSLISFGCITAATALAVFLSSQFLSIPNMLIDAYFDNGFVYCFSRSAIVHGVERPDDDAVNKKDEFMDNLGTTVGTVPTDAPNIVIVQLESFFDVKYVKDVEFSRDPIPNYTALKESGVSGFMDVTQKGGGTSNIEFEFLTGMNLKHFGPGEFPHTTILKQRACESLATNLKQLGYSAHALHNHIATFYNRNTVYSSLGFDTFTPLEMMTNIERNILTFCTDDVLVREIEFALDSTEAQDLVFAISVEGHGGYPNYDLGGYYTKDDIEVIGIEDEEVYHQYHFYVKLIEQMDQTVKDICELMEARGEPYVLVFYGDHLPALPIADDQVENGNVYQTEYVIKTNIELAGAAEVSDINELDKNLTAYQLAAYIQQLCGMSVGDITRLHQHEFETGESYNDILETLTYEQLYADEAKYEPSDMKIGTRPVVLDSYYVYGQTLYIYGSGFNTYSKVKVNGIKRGTTYIDENTLAIENVQNIRSIQVLQLADDGTELAASNTIE